MRFIIFGTLVLGFVVATLAVESLNYGVCSRGCGGGYMLSEDGAETDTPCNNYACLGDLPSFQYGLRDKMLRIKNRQNTSSTKCTMDMTGTRVRVTNDLSPKIGETKAVVGCSYLMGSYKMGAPLVKVTLGTGGRIEQITVTALDLVLEYKRATGITLNGKVIHPKSGEIPCAGCENEELNCLVYFSFEKGAHFYEILTPTWTVRFHDFYVGIQSFGLGNSDEYCNPDLNQPSNKCQIPVQYFGKSVSVAGHGCPNASAERRATKICNDYLTNRNEFSKCNQECPPGEIYDVLNYCIHGICNCNPGYPYADRNHCLCQGIEKKIRSCQSCDSSIVIDPALFTPPCYKMNLAVPVVDPVKAYTGDKISVTMPISGVPLVTIELPLKPPNSQNGLQSQAKSWNYFLASAEVSDSGTYMVSGSNYWNEKGDNTSRLFQLNVKNPFRFARRERLDV